MSGAVALEPRTIGRAVGHPGVAEINTSGRRCTLRVRRVSLPTRGDHGGGAWYVRYSLSYRDVEELLAERGIEVDHTTLFRWVARFTPLFTEAARPLRHTPGDRWFVDETYVKVAGKWRYLYRALDQFGQPCCVALSATPRIPSTRRCSNSAELRRPSSSQLRGICLPWGVSLCSPTTN